MSSKLIVVADAARAHFVSCKGIKLHDITKELVNTEFETREPDNLRNGHMQNHFLDPPTPAKEIEKISFASVIVDEMHRQVLKEKYDTVILVAPAKMIGHIRKKANGHCPIDRSISMNAINLNIKELEDVIFS